MNDPLAVYLHDHLAGSSFAVELLEKLAVEFSGSSTGGLAGGLLEQVKIDRQTLDHLISKVGKASSDLYDALGWMAERISRIKLKSDDAMGLETFEAFETICLGILGKRSLWQALKATQTLDLRLAGLNYDALIDRAEQQFEKANQFRLHLAGHALNVADKH